MINKKRTPSDCFFGNFAQEFLRKKDLSGSQYNFFRHPQNSVFSKVKILHTRMINKAFDNFFLFVGDRQVEGRFTPAFRDNPWSQSIFHV